MEKIEPYLGNSDYLGYFKSCWHRFGVKAIYKQFRPHVRRSWSRNLLKKFAPEGFGIEIGSGYQTIAPISRTVLTDAYEKHGDDQVFAKLVVKSEAIPFESESFNFVLSEHVLEHIADPIKSLLEWQRVLKSGGVVVLFMPHPDRTFDRARPRTKLAHLIEDHARKVPDNDPTHYDEWRALVIDKGLAPHYEGYTKEQILNQALIHHHVWTAAEIRELFDYLDFKVLYSEDFVPDREDSFVVVAQKK